MNNDKITNSNNEANRETMPAILYRQIKTPNGEPIYIVDDLEIFKQIQAKDKYYINSIIKALFVDDTAGLFNFTINTPGTPIIFLLKTRDKKAENVINKIKQIGAPVFYQDANQKFKTITETNINEVKKEIVRQYQSNYSAGGTISEFRNIIKSNANTPPIKTGYDILDKCLDGGLYEGLYAIGAISSLGKTTFCLNIAEQIAKSGQDVIIIALEMSKYALIGRSISRLTFLKHQEHPEKYNYAWCKTSRGITDGSRYKNYSKEEKELINECIDDYAEHIGNHLFIHEAVKHLTVDDITNIVIRHIFFTGNKPVVIVDYLQLIQHEDKYLNSNDKIRTDFNLTELKQLSRDYKLPIIAISSFNRAGYNTEVKFECFKESGGIDFACDVIMGLQLSGVGTPNFNVNEEKAKDPREIELVFLKNREAPVGEMIKYYYYPKFNNFNESDEDIRAKREYENEQAKAAKERDKQNKAELIKSEHEALVKLAFNACNKNGTALLTDMVEFLGGKPVYKTLERYVKETGKYNIIGNKVIIK